METTTTTLSDQQIFRILENPEPLKFPPAFLSTILEKDSDLTDKLSKLINYFRSPSSQSRDAVVSGKVPLLPNLPAKPLPGGKGEIDLILTISAVLQIDEQQCVHIWSGFLASVVEGSIKWDQSRLHSLETLIFVRDFYFNQMNTIWKILQEIIRISGDNNHVYHEPVATYLDKLLNKGLLGNLLSTIERLYSFQHCNLKKSDLKSVDLSPQDFTQFQSSHRDSVAEDILCQIERGLEAFILLLYCRPECVSIEEFHKLLVFAVNGEFSVPRELWSSPEKQKNRISFKWLLVFTSMFQFWRLYVPDIETSRHNLLGEGTTSNLLLESVDGIIFSLGRSRSGVGYQTVPGTAPSRKNVTSHTTHAHEIEQNSSYFVMKLLWGHFLRSFSQYLPISLTRRAGEYIKESYRNGAVNYLVQLIETTLERPNHVKTINFSTTNLLNTPDAFPAFHEENQSGCDLTVYCSIFQEFLNVLIDHTCFEETILDLAALSSLVELLYRADENLCGCIWSRWVSSPLQQQLAEQNYPLCKLIKLLVETSFHEPHHLLKILSSLTCSAYSSREVLLIISSPTFILSIVPARNTLVGVSRRLDGEISWNSATWLQDKTIPHHLPILYQPVASQTDSRPSLSFVTPPPQTVGILLQYQQESQSILAKWQCESSWFALMMNALESIPDQSESSDVKLSLLISTISIFSSLISFLGIKGINILMENWEQICLFTYLRSINILDIYPNVVNLKITTQDLKREPSIIFHRLNSSGVDQRSLHLLFENIRACYCPEFTSLLIESTVNLIFRFSNLPYFSSHLNGEIWRQSLSCSLYLLRCITLSTPSASLSLSILSFMAKVFERNDWTAIFFQITSSVEGVIGRYEVTEQTLCLLFALLSQLQAPLPANSQSLNLLFEKFDADGNGTISREELQKGLQEMGYQVPISTVDCLFKQIDLSNSSSIHFSQLLQYAATNVTRVEGVDQVLSATPRVFTSDLDRAEYGLMLLLEDVLYPESRERVQLGGWLAQSAVEFSMDCLAHLDRWNFCYSSHRWGLTLSCVTILSAVVSAISQSTPRAVQTSAIMQAGNLFFRRFIRDKQLQVSLMHCCFNLSLTALHASFSSAYRETRSLKSVITEPSSILPGTTSGGLQPTILPVHFSGGYSGISSSVDVELLESLSMKTMLLLTQILNIATQPYEHHSHEDVVACARQVLELLYSNADTLDDGPFGNRISNALLTSQTSAITSVGLPCLYVSVLTSLLDYPVSPVTFASPQISHLPLSALQFMTTLVGSLRVLIHPNQLAKKSFVEGLGYQNIIPFCRTLCSWMSLKTNPALKYAILDFLLVLCNSEPLTIVLLFNVLNPNEESDDKETQRPHPIRTEKSLLAQTLLKLLHRAEYLYREHPAVLFKLYQLVLKFLDKSNHLSIGNFILLTMRSQQFWDSLTVPLMEDLPEPPGPSFADLRPNLPQTHGNYSIFSEQMGEIPLFCFRLQTHAIALRILARERFGTLFYIDSNNSENSTLAEKIEKIVDSFFEKANNSHRFFSWVKHYMRVQVDYDLQKQVEKSSKAIGLNLESLITPKISDLGVLAYGGSYLYNYKIAERISVVANYELSSHPESCSRRSSVLSVSTAQDMWEELLQNLIRLNCMWSIADTQMILLRSWREFVEIYVQSFPNRPASYLKHLGAQQTLKRKDSLDSRDSRDSDDDIPSTPPSFHSKSQSSGAHSPNIFSEKQSPQSPSRENPSSFTGDKRSYELVSEIMKQLTNKQKSPNVTAIGENFLAANIAMEKCNLLVSMLHHQLKHVSYRTTDPSQSKVLNRDTGSIRLKPQKMIDLLQGIEMAYHQYVSSLDIHPPAFFKIKEYQATRQFWLQSKRNISLRLLTAMLILYQGLHSSNFIELRSLTDVNSSGFQIAIDVITSELAMLEEKNEEALLLETLQTQIDGNGRISTSQAIIQVSFRLLAHLSPSSMMSLGSSELNLWNSQIESSQLIRLMIGTLYEISERGKKFVQNEYNYGSWEDSTLIFSGTVSSGPISSLIEKKHNKLVSWEALECVVDYILREGLKKHSLIFFALIQGGLLIWLTESSIFQEMQRVLVEQPRQKSAAFMGYLAMTGEVSRLSQIWSKVIQIAQCTLRWFLLDGISSEFLFSIQNQLSAFVNTYRDILLLPLPDGRGRISLQQLELSRVVLQFFTECYRMNPVWKVVSPLVSGRLVSTILRMIGLFSLLLGDGDEKYSNTQQRTLHCYMVAISQQEKRAERRHTNRRDRAASKLWDQTGDLEPSTKRPLDLGGQESKIYHSPSMVLFIADAVQGILSVCEPSVTLIRTILINSGDYSGKGFEVDSMNGKLQSRREHICSHPIGSRIFYSIQNSDLVSSFSQGIVYAIDSSKKFYTVRLPSGELEYNIPCTSVVFQNSPPVLQFESTLSLPRYLETDISSIVNDSVMSGSNRGFLQGGYISYKSEGEIPTSTGHLVRLLKFARNWEDTLNRSLSSDRRCMLTTFKPNLDHFCGWMGVNIETLGKQLDEIENLLQVQDAQGHHWISSEEWNQTRDWVSKMINRIMGPHRSNLNWSYDTIEIEEPFDSIYPSKHRRSNGPSGYGSLRSGVSFLDI